MNEKEPHIENGTAFIKPYEGNEPYLFISYARKDSDIVLPIIEQLQSRGVRLWYDAGIKPSQKLRKKIASKINACHIYVALFSENFYLSDWCSNEFDFAFDNKKKILAIVLDDKPVQDDYKLTVSGNLMVKKSQYQNLNDFYRRILETEGIDQCISAAPVPKTDTSEQIDSSQADNQEYLNHFTEPMFLEEDDDSKVTLASMYVSPHLKDKHESVAACIMDWFKATTRTTCMLLFGNAGIGKSSLVSKIIADANNETENKEFPFNADQVRAVALRNHCDEIDLTKKADEILTSLFSGYAKQQLKSKLLILDGLDEVCVLCKDFDGYKFLEKLAQLERGFHVLVTSREATNYFSDPKDIQDLRTETLQWTIPETEIWCSKYCNAKEDKKQWCTQFIEDYKCLDEDKNDYRKEAFCVPIILYICGESEIKLSDHKNIGSIYGDAFRKILLRAHLRGHGDYTDLTEADKMSNLIAWQYTKEIAYQMFLLDTLDLAESDDPDNRYAIGLNNAKARTITILQEKYRIDVPDDALKLKKELALCPFTRSNGTGGITFAHKTVYEYFTAIKLYEDYFAKFNKSYFDKTDIDEAAEDVMKATIAAFRYKATPPDIFKYLCEMHEAPFSDPTGEKFDYLSFEKAFVQAMENRALNKITVKLPVEEYYISHDAFDPLNSQIVRAFLALINFLTGHGFRNQTDSKSCKQISKILVSSDQFVSLNGWNLSGADLTHANLIHANLTDADLSGADLTCADLTFTYLTGANLTGANLTGADLTCTNLTDADLTDADLTHTNLTDADLTRTILTNAYLREAYSTDVDWGNEDLRRAILTKANLSVTVQSC